MFEQGKPAEGEKILRDLIETDPQDPSSKRALASELADPVGPATAPRPSRRAGRR
jgi:hypothetical protein